MTAIASQEPTHERFFFRNITRIEGQSLDGYLTELKNAVSPCKFGYKEENITRDHIIFEITDVSSKEKLSRDRNITKTVLQSGRNKQNLDEELRNKKIVLRKG